MRKQLMTLAVAMLTAGALTTSCDNEDNIIDISQLSSAEKTIAFTATLAPKGDGGGQTRAITTGTDNVTGKEILNVTWAAGEKIALYYEKNNGTYATALATVGTPNANGSAPINANLTDAKGGTVKFIYPYGLAQNGELKTGAGSHFRTQDGTIEYISQYLDAATATGTIDVTDGTATLAGTVTMQNQVCICKFNFTGMDLDETENYYDITIREMQGSSTTNTYETTSIGKASMGAVYMALLGAENKDFRFSVQGMNKSSASDPSGTQKKYYEVNSSNVTLTAGKFYRSIPVSLGNSQSQSTITIPAGGTYTLNNMNITVTNGPAIECEGDATIILEGTNSVTSSANWEPAIFIPEGKTLTIRGTGSLVATATGVEAAGIGGKSYNAIDKTCGNIVIEGGVITATGGDKAAGIGSGYNGKCGDITISGGTVTATGGDHGAGIGCSNGGSCGNITISGGTVMATGTNSAAGIGCALSSTVCGDITISGGTVTAIGNYWAAGIGSCNEDRCGNITISGGTVTATGGYYAAGIGSGFEGKCGDITITNEVTSVTATMGFEADAPIGKGKNDNGSGTVTIDGTTIWMAGTATEHFNWGISTVKDGYEQDVTRWTLTHK